MQVTEELKLSVWNKWTIVNWYDSKNIRKDTCGAWIRFDKFLNRDSIFGWEVDHITPQNNWWSDSLSNLRPLQWKNNISKSDWRLVCKIVSNWTSNIEKN